MAVKIYIPADKALRFFHQNKEKLKSAEAIIAENDETKHMVCLTNDGGFPTFVVYRDGIRVIERDKCSTFGDDCMDTAKFYFEEFLFPCFEEKEPEEQPGSAKIEVVKGGKLEEEEDDEEFNDTWKRCHDMLTVPLDKLAVSDPVFDVMYVRQDEVKCAVEDFLNVLLEETPGKDYVEDFTHEIIIKLCEDGFDVWYPMEYTDPESGDDWFSTYPYNDPQ